MGESKSRNRQGFESAIEPRVTDAKVACSRLFCVEDRIAHCTATSKLIFALCKMLRK